MFNELFDKIRRIGINEEQPTTAAVKIVILPHPMKDRYTRADIETAKEKVAGKRNAYTYNMLSGERLKIISSIDLTDEQLTILDKSQRYTGGAGNDNYWEGESFEAVVDQMKKEQDRFWREIDRLSKKGR